MDNSNCGWPFTGNPLKALKFTTDKKSVRSVTVVFTVEIFSGNFWRECFCKSDVQRTLKRNKNVSRVTLSTAKQHKVPVHYQKAHEFLLIPPCLSLTVVKVWTEQVQSTHLEVGRKQSPESLDYKRGNLRKLHWNFGVFRCSVSRFLVGKVSVSRTPKHLGENVIPFCSGLKMAALVADNELQKPMCTSKT